MGNFRFIAEQSRSRIIIRGIIRVTYMTRRRPSGNSMVEYSIGIGAVLAVCMLVLGGLGFAAQDIMTPVLSNINAPNDQVLNNASPGNGPGGIWTNGIKGTTNPPWQPR
jgi:hypothetical protein